MLRIAKKFAYDFKVEGLLYIPRIVIVSVHRFYIGKSNIWTAIKNESSYSVTSEECDWSIMKM